MKKVRFDLSVEEPMREGIRRASRAIAAEDGLGRKQSDWVRGVIARELDLLYGDTWKNFEWRANDDASE